MDMMRAFFISLSKLQWAQRVITRSPLASRVAMRFVAGETINEAVAVIRKLNKQGLLATLDHLGEDTLSPEDALSAVEEICHCLEVIQANDLRCNVSLKLSQIGLNLSTELCKDNLRIIMEKAAAANNFVRIDMEDSSLTDKTLEVFQWAKESGIAPVGIVLQAYLYRTKADIENLTRLHATYRLCKGAYQEPADIAFPQKKAVDENYDALAKILLAQAAGPSSPRLSSNGRFPGLAGLATHDEKRIVYAKQIIDSLKLDRNAMEFQMLYGIRSELQEKLAGEGYPVRVYVPYGTHWYRYFMRRLAERPANVWFFVQNFFKR